MRLQPNQWVGKQAFAVSTDGMTECNNFKSTSDFITLLTESHLWGYVCVCDSNACGGDKISEIGEVSEAKTFPLRNCT